MEIVFISNYFNHHQEAFSNKLYELLAGNYSFIATKPMREERKQLGYGMEEMPDYVYYTYKGKEEAELCQKKIDEADVVIIGSAPDELIKNRVRNNKLVLRYSERMLKKGMNWFLYLPRMIKLHLCNPRNKNMYLLSAGAYSASDYGLYGLYKNRAYKWGYFPKTKKYDIRELMEKKDKNSIIWCGRFIDWKHPEIPVAVAKKLKQDGICFQLNMIGSGVMKEEIRNLVQENNLSDCVHVLDSMKPEQVRSHMETSGIYLFTSDFQEGWGAVLNESMNSGCAVVASHAIGSAPYLVENGVNGYIYENGNIDDLYNKVKQLLEHHDEQNRIGVAAYKTIAEEWNAESAAERLLQLVDAIRESGDCRLFETGICSKAEILKNNWFQGV